MSQSIRYFMAIYGGQRQQIAAYSIADAKQRAQEIGEEKGMLATSFYEVFPLPKNQESQGGAK